MPRPGGLVVVPVVLCVVVLLSGCTGGGAEPRPSSSSGTPTAVVEPAPTPVVEPSATQDGTAPPAAPQPTRPATTAGSLRQASLPPPRALGPGWRYRVDSGDVEGNYVGNGTPAQSRDPAEVVAALHPMGCGNEAASLMELPRPAHALEVDYGHSSGASAVALALEFADPGAAAAFVATYRTALRTCTPPSPPPGTLVVSVQPTPSAADLLTAQRDPLQGTTWTELVALRGSVAVLVGAQVAGRAALPRWDAVAAAIR